MRTKLAVVLMTSACLGYALLSGERLVAFVQSGNLIGLAMAAGIAGVIGVSGALIVREIRFGASIAAMAKVLEAESGLPLNGVARTPAGRIEPASAESQFEKFRAAVEADETSWRNWYLLAVAYDDARDRPRARGAMRRAERLFRSN